jgi:hypothetical protein
LIANSRILIDNLVKEEEKLEEQAPLTDNDLDDEIID